MAMGLGSKRPVTDINVTPLIDVVLVLLIIFMVLTPLAEKQKYLRVPDFQPDVQALPPNQPEEQTVVTVKTNGRVLLNKQEMSVEEATQRLGVAYEGRPSKVLFFNAEDDVRYELAFQVLDAIHASGVNTIGMMSDPPTFAMGAGEAAPAAPAPQ